MNDHASPEDETGDETSETNQDQQSRETIQEESSSSSSDETVIDQAAETYGDTVRDSLENTDAGADPDPSEGSTLGTKYSVTGEIGKGGMGQVLEGVDLDLRRQLAIKTMLQDREVDPASVTRFIEEAQVQGQLTHPNICPVYELGMDEDDQLFFTMKKVQGDSLAEILAGLRNENPEFTGDYDRTNLLEIFSKLCDAIAYAHSKGVIHRDLKPENVMVGQFGEVQVMDWGLAKIRGEEDDLTESEQERANRKDRMVVTDRVEEGKLLSVEGNVMGTPAYMPPEQADGQVEKIDEQSDVYALGAILYEMLSGKPPVQEETVGEMLEAARNNRISDPREVETDQPVPVELAEATMKALSGDKTNRYKTADAFRTDIEAFREGKTLKAATYNPLQLAGKWISRHRWPVGAAVAVLFAVSGVISYIQYNRYRTYRNHVNEARSHLNKQNPSEAKEDLVVAAGQYRSLEVAEMKRKANRILRKQKAKNTFQKGKKQRRKAQKSTEKRKKLKKMERARNLMENAVRTYPETIPENWKTSLEAVRRKNYTIAFKRVWTEVRLIQEVTREMNRRRRQNIPYTKPYKQYKNLYAKAKKNIQRLKQLDTADTWWAAGHVAEQMGLYKNAEKYFRNAIQKKSNHRLALVDLGTYLIEKEILSYFIEPEGKRHQEIKSNIQNAIQYLTKAKHSGTPDRYGRLTGDQYQKKIQMHVQLGKFYRLFVNEQFKQLRKGLRSLDDTPHFSPEYLLLEGLIHLYRKKPSQARDAFARANEKWPGSAEVRSWYALTFQDQEKRIKHFSRALQIHPRHSRSWFLRGNAFSKLGRYEKAIQDYSRALEINPVITEAFLNRGSARRSIGKYKKAIQDHTRAIKLDSDLEEAYYNRGEAKRKLGRHQEAIQDYTRALEINPKYARALNNRGTLKQKLGKYKEAIRDLTRAIEFAPNNATYYYNRAEAKREQNAHQEAIQDLNQAIQLDPNNAKAYYQRGISKMALKNMNQAISDFTRAIEINPGYTKAYNTRGVVKKELDQHSEALNDFTKSIQTNQNYFKAYMNRGLLRIRKFGMVQGGMNDLRTALNIVPKGSRTRKKIRNIIEQINDHLQKKKKEH